MAFSIFLTNLDANSLIMHIFIDEERKSNKNKQITF